jgi:hypothetical protein
MFDECKSAGWMGCCHRCHQSYNTNLLRLISRSRVQTQKTINGTYAVTSNLAPDRFTLFGGSHGDRGIGESMRWVVLSGTMV